MTGQGFTSKLNENSLQLNVSLQTYIRQLHV